MTRVVLAFVISLLPGIARADDDPVGEGEPPVQPEPTQPAPTQPGAEEPDPPQHYEKPIIQTGGFRPREIVVEVPGLRTTQQKLMVGALLGAGVVGGSIGLYFNLQSRSDANKVSAQLFTGKAWTPDRQQSYDDAKTNRKDAAIGYAIGGAFVIGAIAAFIATEPKSETTVIRPHAAVVPTSGGAFATLGGSF